MILICYLVGQDVDGTCSSGDSVACILGYMYMYMYINQTTIKLNYVHSYHIFRWDLDSLVPSLFMARI